jgi:hypothetical protein
LGEIALTRRALPVTLVSSCSNPISRGGSCDFRVRIRNLGDRPVTGVAWSTLAETGRELGTTTGTLGVLRQRLSLAPGQSRESRFRLELPARNAWGRTLCADVFIGRDPHPLSTAVQSTRLLCLTAEGSGYRLLRPTAWPNTDPAPQRVP